MILRPLNEPVLSFTFKLIAFFVTILGGLIIRYVIIFNKSISYNLHLLNDRRAMMWFMVPISTQIILKLPIKLGSYSLKIMDQG